MNAASAPPVHVLTARLRHVLETIALDLGAFQSTGDPEHVTHALAGVKRAQELRDAIEMWSQ